MPQEDLFDRIAAVDNLRRAWIRARHYAGTEEFYFDAYAYSSFGEHVEANLEALRHELLGGTYEPAALRQVVIPKGDQLRRLYFLRPRDSVVIQAVMN